jgi:hypothetical protein
MVYNVVIMDSTSDRLSSLDGMGRRLKKTPCKVILIKS